MSQYDSSDRLQEFLTKAKLKPVPNTDGAAPSSAVISGDEGVEISKQPVTETLDAQNEFSQPTLPTLTSPKLRPDVEVFVAGAHVADTRETAIEATAPKAANGQVQEPALDRQTPQKGHKLLKDGNMLDIELSSPARTPTQIELLTKMNNQENSLPNNHHAVPTPPNSQKQMIDRSESFLPEAAPWPPGAGTDNDDVPNVALAIEASQVAGESQWSQGPQTDQTSNVSPASEDSIDVHHNHHNMAAVLSNPPTPSTAQGKYKPAISIASPTLSPTPVTVHQSPTPVGSTDAGALQKATKILASKIADIRVDSREPHEKLIVDGIAQEGEDREHAKYFTAWGAPETRNKPKSQVRRVILTGLPPYADFSLVASLVHGGALESIALNPATRSAHVLFTTSEACNAYYDAYPNGLSVKHKGRSLLVFVDKGKEVDVISSMLEGYLLAGASRIVCASNVDEDWSMKALHRIAEGDKHQRKVESIIDNFRNETRTVIFRFANIADAVSFRRTLQRVAGWETSEVGFTTDPCEKAAGFHFDC